MKTLKLIFLAVVFVFNANSQNKIDSLKNCMLNLQNQEQELDILLKLCYNYRDVSLEHALEYGIKARSLAQELKLQLKEAKGLRYIGLIKRSQFKYEESLQYINRALKVYQNNKDYEGKLKCLSSIALVYSQQDNYDKAIEYYNKVDEHWKEHRKYNKTCATSFNNAGAAYLRRGNYNKAIEYNKLALKLQIDLNDEIGKARSFNNIAIVYRKQGLYNKALKLYKQALNIFEEKGRHRNIAFTLNNMGEVYQRQGIYAKALECQKKALDIRQKLAFEKDLASSYHSLGITYYKKEKNLASLDCFHKALRLEENTSSRKYMAETLYYMGKVTSRIQGFDDKVIDYCERSLLIAEDIGALRDVVNACNLLDTVYSRLNNSKKAIMYRQKAETIQLALQEQETFKVDEYYSPQLLQRLKNEKVQLLKENEEQKMLIDKKKDQISIWLSITMLMGFVLIISLLMHFKTMLSEKIT